jgi:guanosine-3',5'-bis(diphosphate) 3'-pyrophosphohydrolase
MPKSKKGISQFWKELKRRKVIHVIVVYASAQVALLHDTNEDTSTTSDELEEYFGEEIATAVLALSKDKNLPKDQRIGDSLNRIKKLPYEVWAVKLADRITNLQPPPSHWTTEKRRKYLEESRLILKALGKGNPYLAGRLEAKIVEYRDRYA